MDKEKLKKELNEIEEKMRLERIRIGNSPESKLLETTISNLWTKYNQKESELRKLKRQIYDKYISKLNTSWGIGLGIKNIKSSVKQGIKRGLGITNLSFLEKYELKYIVKQLINKDLEETNADKLTKEVRSIYTQIVKCGDDKKKLSKGLNALAKQRKEVYNKLHKKAYLQEKRIEKGRKEVKIKIENLSKYMDKIIKEVNKRLILEELK